MPGLLARRRRVPDPLELSVEGTPIEAEDLRRERLVAANRLEDAQDVAALDSSTRSELTLVTCYPFSYLGPAPLRFIVHARRILSIGA